MSQETGEKGEKGTQKLVVTFLGPVASYTHQATLSAFPNTTHTLTPVTTISDVFASVHTGTASLGVVPFENSSNGSVVFTLDLFADVQEKYPDIVVCAEEYVAVRHCLLGRAAGSEAASVSSFASLPPSDDREETTAVEGGAKAPAAPLTSLAHIKKLYSHPQAWGQCKGFLDTHLKGVERHDVSSTSRAAQIVAEDTTKSSAAVSSAFAAEVYGVGLLAQGIEDRGDNVTRFFVIRRRDTASTSLEPASGKEKEKEGKEYKTLISFTVDHANPGSLAHSLAVFEKYGLNLTSINTRPSGVENWNYIFFVELKGRREEGKDDGPVNAALRELDGVCRSWRWLGSWESRLARR